MKTATFLFYLFLALLPTQLGRHFFFDFSLISGLRSDYLAPTLYLSDVIILLIFFSVIPNHVMPNLFRHPIGILKQVQDDKRIAKVSLFFVLCSLFFVNILVAINKWAALYKLIKIVELVLLGWVIVRIKPNLLTVLKVFSFTVFYSSLIAFGQFISQKSLGGLFWFLGERSFYAGTPGIAAISFDGRLLLRPYATFPHPNVMGGFLAIVLPFLLAAFLNYRKQIGKLFTLWFFTCIAVGFIALILSFSRAAWLVASIGFLFAKINRKNSFFTLMKARSNLFLIFFYCLIFFSTLIPLVLPQNIFSSGQSLSERSRLIDMALRISFQNPYFGVGLNNFIVQIRTFVDSYPSIYSFQPVHNIYLLITAETGLSGFLLFLSILLTSFRRSFSSATIVIFPLLQIYLLGFFDHYLVTLQQGQLLFAVFIALALIPRNKVN